MLQLLIKSNADTRNIKHKFGSDWIDQNPRVNAIIALQNYRLNLIEEISSTPYQIDKFFKAHVEYIKNTFKQEKEVKLEVVEKVLAALLEANPKLFDISNLSPKEISAIQDGRLKDIYEE